MVQWLPELRVEVWESFLSIPETDPQHVSRHLVGFEALEVFATHNMGHSMSQYEVVLCQCGDCMRLCCLRCGLEWSGRQMSIVNALPQHWRRGQVQVATVCGPVWKLGSQKKSWFKFQMVSVSDGFGMFWVFVIVGPVTPHARIWYCRIWGSLWWFREVVIFCLAMLGRDLERSRRFCSVFCLFRLLQKCRGELQALAMPICIARSKVGSVSGPTSGTCFLPHREEGFVGLIFHSSFARRLCLCSWVVIVTILYYSSILVLWGSCRYRLPSFLMCFDTWEMWSVAYALRIYGSLCPEVPAVYTTFQAWSGEKFCHGQTNLKPINFQRESWRTVEGHDVWEYGSQNFDWVSFCTSIWMLLQTIFQAATSAAQLRIPMQATVGIIQNHWIAGGRILRRV